MAVAGVTFSVAFGRGLTRLLGRERGPGVVVLLCYASVLQRNFPSLLLASREQGAPVDSSWREDNKNMERVTTAKDNRR